MKRIAKTIDRITRGFAQAGFWLLLAMVLVGAFNSIARYAGRGLGVNLSSNAYLELQWYLFALVFFLGGAYVLDKNAHVRVDILYDRVSPKTKAWIDLVGTLLLLIPFCIFGIWMSYSPVLDSWMRLEMSADPNGLPRYPIKTVIPLGFLLLLLQAVSQVLKKLHFIKHGKELLS